ncbi:hypothetical protein BLNAU_3231 [Blattamonas nauphoetae]|uniref:Uncharacterized protein n=1 Tax=Blattamonas nauphoetae TaxID=2049346 RepID=A0ABQ9YDI5_9EUKA|nr:hypothetical protein BLNAU_3231 [Blattamonas nauphoetae]
MEARWGRIMGQRENIAAGTGTRRISGRNRTDTSSRSLIYERKGCEETLIQGSSHFGNELSSASLVDDRNTERTLSPTSHISLDVQVTSHADPSMLPTRSVLTLWCAPFSIFILVFDSFFLVCSLLFRFQEF